MSVPVTTLFALEYHVVDDYVARRAPFRDAHLRLAGAAYARGELRLGGEAFASQDPYVVNGLVSRWHVHPWAVAVGG